MAIELRSYQKRLVEAAHAKGNCLFVLPTGSGKTLTAAELIRQSFGDPLLPSTENDASLEANKAWTDPTKITPRQTKVLFLVPQVILVEQQAVAIRGWLGHSRAVKGFSGGQKPPDPRAYDVLVAIPDVFEGAGNQALTRISAGGNIQRSR